MAKVEIVGLVVLIVNICTVKEILCLYDDPNCLPERDTIVHLFEWKWTDIKQECERFLGPKGYCAVQTSPPNENAVITNPHRPWWERYQPVSYTIQTRSGNEQEFRDMVQTCNKHGVRIYIDTIINHMTAEFSGTGTAGNSFNGTSYDYPGVPYEANDFNGHDKCNTIDLQIHDLESREELRDCKLLGLDDLALGKEHVRTTISGYMNKLIDMGVAGFRIDAAKHMWPGDLSNLFARLNDLPTAVFGSGKRPFIFQEIIDTDGGPVKSFEYFNTGRVTNFEYGLQVASVFLKHSRPAKNFEDLGSQLGISPSDESVVFLSNHDSQRAPDGRGSPITFRNPKQLKVGTAFMLAFNFGIPRIMSSFNWTRKIVDGSDSNSWQGPPHNADMTTMSVQISQNMLCSGGWICEHRWPEIYRMVEFRNTVSGTNVENFQTFGDYQVAFSRGNKGFVALVGDTSVLTQDINTGLPPGKYCDVISGEYSGGICTGEIVLVGDSGLASISIDGNRNVPVLAIHIGAKM